jgi:hypothetical protein
MNKRLSLIIVGLLFLMGCNADKNPTDQPKPVPVSPDSVNPEPANPNQQSEINIDDYFPKEKHVKYFKGVGNEFATETHTFYEKQDDLLPVIIDNGGTSILKVYQLNEQGIFLVYEQAEYYEDEVPSLQSLQAEFKETSILTKPIKVGKVINGWKIVSVDEELTIQVGTLNKVIVLEKVNQDGSLNREYWAPTYGLVKKEFYMKHEDGNETLVTSELEKVIPQN